MDAKELERIVGKMDALKTKRAKAEGAMETEKASWLKQWKIKSKEELEKKLKEAEDELEGIETKKEAAATELKGLTNWNLL